MKRPACFDSEEQWQEWCAAADQPGALLDYAKFCVDCMPAYQNEMIESYRCAHEDTVFVIQKGAITGVQISDRGWYGSVTGIHCGSGKKSVRAVVAMGSAEAVIIELRRRKAG